MQTLMQKARAGRTKALMSLQFSRDISFEQSNARRFPELKHNDVVALFDTTQWYFSHNTVGAEAKIA